MDDQSTGYVPRSPDLSAYHSAPAAPATVPLPPTSHHTQTYQPPNSSYSPPSGIPFPHHQQQQQQQQHYQNPGSFTQQSYYTPPVQNNFLSPHQYQHQHNQYEYHDQPIDQQQMNLRQYESMRAAQEQARQAQGQQHQHQYHHQQQHQQHSAGPSDPVAQPPPPRKTRGPGRKSKKQKLEEENYGTTKPAPGVLEGIEVKTKFPVARIKRIMQADDDVGKVAQVTPTAVSKALELFMISLVTKAAAEARAKSSKKVTGAHLKQIIQQDEQFDFLAEIVANVPDAPAASNSNKKGSGGGGPGSAAAATTGEDDSDAGVGLAGEAAGKKRKATRSTRRGEGQG